MGKYNHLIPVYTILIIGITLSFFVQYQRNKALLNSKSKELEMIVDNNTEIIRRKILTNFSSIELVRSLFENQDKISRQEFKNYTTPIFQGNLSINAISWIPKVADSEKNRFELKIRNELHNAQFHITEKNSNNKLIAATKSPFYFPVTYIEPLSENIAALGYDISSNHARLLAINKASTYNKLYISSKIKLVQDSTQNSFLGIIPVYYSKNNNEDSTSIENVKGLISAVFKIKPMIKNALELTQHANIELIIFDVTDKSKVLIYGDNKLLNKRFHIHKRSIKLGGKIWELDFLANSNFYHIDNKYSYLLTGVFASFLLFIILLFPHLKEKRSKILAKRLKDEQSIREKTELSLSESEEYNRTLFLESTIGLLLNSMDGNFVDANPALCKMVGRTKEEILSLTYWDLTPERYNEQEQFQLKDMTETGYYGPYEKEYIHKDGHLVPVRLQGKIILRNGIKYIWSSVEDITERKLAEDALKKSEEEFRSLAESMPQIVWVTRVDGSNIYFNQQWVDYTGLSLEESYGEGWNRPFHPDDKQRAWEAWDNAVKNNGTYSIEVRLRRFDGEYFWWLIRGIPQFNEKGETLKWFGTCTDIEDIKMSEDKIKSQLAELMRFNSTMVDRELKMIELKQEINDYCAKLNLPEKYTIAK